VDQYLQDIFDAQLAKEMKAAELDGPVEPEDANNPHFRFWALVRTGSIITDQFYANARYFASGRCGGCETCGDRPFPRVPLNASEQYKDAMRQVLADMQAWDERIKGD
jgi:hypothetical protein